MAKYNSGKLAENHALMYLEKQGLQLIAKNFRCRAGEIDLILKETAQPQDILVFVEVRQRRNLHYGGAIYSVTQRKQARLIMTAQFFLQRYPILPVCRFDVFTFEGETLEWIKQAFEM